MICIFSGPIWHGAFGWIITFTDFGSSRAYDHWRSLRHQRVRAGWVACGTSMLLSLLANLLKVQASYVGYIRWRMRLIGGLRCWESMALYYLLWCLLWTSQIVLSTQPKGDWLHTGTRLCFLGYIYQKISGLRLSRSNIVFSSFHLWWHWWHGRPLHWWPESITFSWCWLL